jgi:hypothetical protein
MARKPNARAKHTKPAKKIALPAAGTSPSPAIELTGERAQLWRDIRSRWALEPASEAMLRNACEALERAHQYSEQVQRDGGTFLDRFGGIKVNPAAQLERDFRGLAARTLQQLAVRLEGG